jgi:hypothetical protein
MNEAQQRTARCRKCLLERGQIITSIKLDVQILPFAVIGDGLMVATVDSGLADDGHPSVLFFLYFRISHLISASINAH